MFKLGARSHANLRGVHPQLVRVVERAIMLSTQDFGVLDGVRTRAQQEELVKKGASTTMNSKHLPQADGFGHAVDLVPYAAGRYRWEWPLIYPIAEAVRLAAQETGVRIRWGGHWAELTGTSSRPDALVESYVSMRRAGGKRAFIDGPHYELMA